METLYDKLHKLELNLRALDRLDQENEVELLADVYEDLNIAYQ